MTNVQAYTRFLNKFGQEVKGIFFEVENPFETQAQFYTMLLELLKSLTSLKNLSIVYNEDYKKSYSTDHFPQLHRIISANPCPVFSKLENLYVNGGLCNQITNEFLKKSNNVESLRQLSPIFYGHSLDYSINLPCLTELQLDIRFDETFLKLKRLGKNWRIKTFSCNCFPIQDKDNWLDIFQMMGDNWSDSLQHLKLWLPNPVHQHGREVVSETTLRLTADGRLELPNLKTFEIFTLFHISLDFLLPSVASLESIEINQFRVDYNSGFDDPLTVYSDTMSKQLVEFLGFERLGRLYDSNIWNWFFKLEWIQSEGKKYLRPARYTVLK